MNTKVIVLPAGHSYFLHVAGSPILIVNQHSGPHAPLYIRVRAKSITVSDRRPASYGNPTGKPNEAK